MLLYWKKHFQCGDGSQTLFCTKRFGEKVSKYFIGTHLSQFDEIFYNTIHVIAEFYVEVFTFLKTSCRFTVCTACRTGIVFGKKVAVAEY